MYSTILGAILLLGGVAHTIGISHRIATEGAPDKHRIAFLAFVTFFHLTGGALDILGGRALARGQLFSRGILTVGAALVMAYSLTMIPVIKASSVAFRVVLIVYSVTHFVLLLLVWRRRSTSVP